MVTISTVIIAKDEENNIADAIDSVKFTDHVIVVDSGSGDRTVELSKQFGAEVFELKTQNFSELRNLGLEKAGTNWVLYIDADERVSEELAQEIEERIKDTSVIAFRLRRKNFYLGKHEWPMIEQMPRLFKRSALEGWYGKLHESPKFQGKAELLDGFLLHYTHRDLTSMLNKTIVWSDLEAEARISAKHPKMSLWRFPRVMIPTFFNYYIRQKGYKLGTAGLIESIFQTYSTFITYAKLWELQEK